MSNRGLVAGATFFSKQRGGSSKKKAGRVWDGRTGGDMAFFQVMFRI